MWLLSLRIPGCNNTAHSFYSGGGGGRKGCSLGLHSELYVRLHVRSSPKCRWVKPQTSLHPGHYKPRVSMLAHLAGHGLCGFTPSSLLRSLEMCNDSSECPPRVPPPPSKGIPRPVPSPCLPRGPALASAMQQGLSPCPDPGTVSDEAIKLYCFRELTTQIF